MLHRPWTLSGVTPQNHTNLGARMAAWLSVKSHIITTSVYRYTSKPDKPAITQTSLGTAIPVQSWSFHMTESGFGATLAKGVCTSTRGLVRRGRRKNVIWIFSFLTTGDHPLGYPQPHRRCKTTSGGIRTHMVSWVTFPASSLL